MYVNIIIFDEPEFSFQKARKGDETMKGDTYKMAVIHEITG